MKTRPDGSAFRRSNVAYGRQPTQPRPRNDGFHWATPRHPEKSKLTICNWFAYFKCTNFGGRSRNRLFIVVFLICHCEEAKRRGNPPKGYHIDVFRINNCTAVKAFALGEKVAAKPTDEGPVVNTLLLFINMSLRGTVLRSLF